MENQSQELDQQSQDEQHNPDQPDQDNNRAGDYNNDAGVIPEEEMEGSDADTDSRLSTFGQDRDTDYKDEPEAEDNEPVNRNTNMDTDESTGGTAI